MLHLSVPRLHLWVELALPRPTWSGDCVRLTVPYRGKVAGKEAFPSARDVPVHGQGERKPGTG